MAKTLKLASDLSQVEQEAWFAGLFEGEGCVSLDRQKRGMRRMLHIVSTDIDVLERAHAIAGCGTVTRKGVRGNRKPCWRWQVGRWRDVERVARLLLRYSLSRRARKLRMLLASPPGKGLGYCPVCKTPFTGPDADVYRKKNGDVQCAPCTRRRMEALRQRRKAAK